MVVPEGDGYIEFVARPVGYNNQDVHTKSTPTTFENKIENAFFLVFDVNSGSRVGFHNVTSSSTSTPHIKLDMKGLTKITACFIANVPYSFAYEDLTSLTELNNAVLSDITYSPTGTIGTPCLDLDDDENTPSVECIPMFGISENISVSSISTSIQITLMRMFAKVSVNLTMDLNSTVQANSYYKIHAYHVHNLPTKVKLIPSQYYIEEEARWAYSESEWVAGDNSFVEKSSITGINAKVFNADAVGVADADKYYTFDMYVPEFFLDPLSANEANLGSNYATEKYKPLMYDPDKNPICLTIDGIFTPSVQLTTQSQPLKYTIFLGEDDCSSFTLLRNILYTNSLIIGGTTNNKDDSSNLDHRVETSPLNLVDMNGESSNCYLINQTGTYYLPPYKGAFKTTEEAERNRCSGTTVVILDADNDDISITNERYDPKTKCVVFDVENIKNGNVIIAVKNGNTIEWSWHLWLNSSFSIGGVGLLEVGYQTYPNGSNFMSRNLGASVLDGEGLYYQYGSKNPYIGSTYLGGGTNGTATWYATEIFVKEDETQGTRFIKTKHDPCPPGYRVPGPNEWDASKGIPVVTTDVLFSYLVSPAVGFGYTGYLDSDNGNKKTTTSSATDDIVDAGTYKISDSTRESDEVQGPGSNTSKVEYRTITRTTNEYINIQYNVPTTQKSGGFWTAESGKAFKYYNYRADWSQFEITNPYDFIDIVGCNYRTYVCRVQQKREKTLLWWGEWKDISGTETPISDMTTQGDASVINTRSNKGALAVNQYQVATTGQPNTQITTSNVNNGFQVRCIKE